MQVIQIFISINPITMKQATKSDLYKAMTRLFNLKGDVNLDNLQIIMDYFHEELVQEYNEEHADTR